MKHLVLGSLLSLSLLLGSGVFAGPGHNHGDGHSHTPVSEQGVKDKAAQKVKQLIQAKKIPESWNAIKANNAEKKTYSNGPEWVVTFKNSSVSDTSKQTLYLFYSLDGHYIAANYTGN